MILATAKVGEPYDIGKPTLIVWLAYAALLVPLVITLAWVFFEKWRMTHRLGRFLCAWCVAARRPPPQSARAGGAAPHAMPPSLPAPLCRFFAFIVLVCALGFSGVSAGDAVVLG